jgi:nucleotide-binding universal stress UspA family protein
MRVLVWIAPGTWPAVIAAARIRPASDEITLVATDDPAEAIPGGPLLGLMGRGRRPDATAAGLSAQAAAALLEQASAALGRPCATRVVTGSTERMVTAAATDADWFIIARDGDRSRLGPHSLGRQARFIIDHAPCTVELIWPESIPGLGTIPPPPQR